ncbi:hypothetical protein L2E82_07380 [Cichorium intybus]|uniref:Uncharacterized protein n=1 Tax=Cichorium intybus TaxID=13427 RepID=A0ACB9G4A7_CICIN|nr:hypothetical protein L2E82_07380 [Cichorium intybus]
MHAWPLIVAVVVAIVIFLEFIPLSDQGLTIPTYFNLPGVHSLLIRSKFGSHYEIKQPSHTKPAIGHGGLREMRRTSEIQLPSTAVVPNLLPFFSNSVYSGFSNKSKGFYKNDVYGNLLGLLSGQFSDSVGLTPPL